jgi:hypothetical protein
VTALLFGRLLAADLFSGPDLGVALQCVVTALSDAPDSKLFRYFALGVLSCVRGDAARWPVFAAAAAAAAPRIRAADPALADDIERAGAGAAAAAARAAGVPEAKGSSGGGAPDGGRANGTSSDDGEPAGGGAAAAAAKALGGKRAAGGGGGDGDIAIGDSVGGSGTGEALNKLLQSNVAQAAALSTLNEKPVTVSLAATINNETLESAERKLREFKAPGDAASDKVSFIMNNLSKQNLPFKAKDLANLVIAPGYVEWFANYLTVKRAAQVRERRGGAG